MVDSLYHLMMSQPAPQYNPDLNPTVPDTLISLIVAFVFAMTVRGFVLEGFVIPTGSMAPTLLGEHRLWRSPETGYVFSTDATKDNMRSGREDGLPLVDPMLDRNKPIAAIPAKDIYLKRRPGDRVLVLKWLYTFTNPNRYDVIVFKNPTNSSENYIKRLIGLPNEEIWLAEGDVFTRDKNKPKEPFVIQRKPEHVQRAMWQPVYDSKYFLINQESEFTQSAPLQGVDWEQLSKGQYVCKAETPTTLQWDSRRWPINDWNSYNMFVKSYKKLVLSTCDIRVATSLTPEKSGLTTTFRIRARSYEYEYVLDSGKAIVRMRPIRLDPISGSPIPASETGWEHSMESTVDLFSQDRVVNLEFWHVDQSMKIFVNRNLAVELNYNWNPYKRLEQATGFNVEELLETSRTEHPWIYEALPSQPELEWDFAGSPLTIHRVSLDRDIYYQPTRIGGFGQPGVATHPKYTAKLTEDQFFVCGDNNSHSKDSRLWGDPDEFVAEQIDPTPFVVPRKLLVGKAWCIYFPSPYSVAEEGRRFIPDFGRVRFIR